MLHKAGFVNIIGRPNAGKSTLMNALIGQKLSITSYKAQTTRHRIFGILNGEDYQVVFSDTPGIIEPAYKLQEAMMRSLHPVFDDADILIILIDLSSKEGVDLFWDKIASSLKPTLVVLNKADAVDIQHINRIYAEWKARPGIEDIIVVSALHHSNTPVLLDKIIALLPVHQPYFDKEDMSDRPVRFFVAEIVREKIFTLYREEIPYSCDVYTEEYKDLPEIAKLTVVITVARDTQKSIILGEKGKSIKQLGILARQEIEEFIGKKVFLELIVKVEKDWRKNEHFLKRRGYIE